MPKLVDSGRFKPQPSDIGTEIHATFEKDGKISNKKLKELLKKSPKK